MLSQRIRTPAIIMILVMVFFFVGVEPHTTPQAKIPAVVTNWVANVFVTLKKSGSKIDVQSETMGLKPELAIKEITNDYVELSDPMYGHRYIFSINHVIGFAIDTRLRVTHTAFIR